MADGEWGLAEAKAKFSDVVEQARTQGPQHVSRNGKPAVVVVSAEEWARQTGRRMSLAEFFDQSPLRDSGIEFDFPRITGKHRDINL